MELDKVSVADSSDNAGKHSDLCQDGLGRQEPVVVSTTNSGENSGGIKNLKPFKPGHSGNPAGRPKVPEDVRIATQLTKVEFARIANRYLMMSHPQMTESLSNPEAPMLEKILGGIITDAVVERCEKKAAFILDRVIGKPEETYHFTNDDSEFDRIAKQIPREKLYQLAQGVSAEDLENITKP
jgi:hypothetical protein